VTGGRSAATSARRTKALFGSKYSSSAGVTPGRSRVVVLPRLRRVIRPTAPATSSSLYFVTFSTMPYVLTQRETSSIPNSSRIAPVKRHSR
jgi:hypothetical protein